MMVLKSPVLRQLVVAFLSAANVMNMLVPPAFPGAL